MVQFSAVSLVRLTCMGYLLFEDGHYIAFACEELRPNLNFAKKLTRAIFRKRKLRNFQHRRFCQGNTRTEQWWATSRSY